VVAVAPFGADEDSAREPGDGDAVERAVAERLPGGEAEVLGWAHGGPVRDHEGTLSAARLETSWSGRVSGCGESESSPTSRWPPQAGLPGARRGQLSG
jgi:hypothetical protein